MAVYLASDDSAYALGRTNGSFTTHSPCPLRWRLSPQPDSESAVDNAADPLPCCPWRIPSPESARRVAPPLRLLRHPGRSVYAPPRVTPIGRTDMSTMRIMTAVALAAVFA